MAIKFIILILMCMLHFGCSSTYVTAYRIDLDGIEIDSSSSAITNLVDENNQRMIEYALDDLFDADLLPEDMDTIIVIIDKNNPFIMGCLDYLIRSRNQSKFYQICDIDDKTIVNTLDSFYTYKQQLIDNIWEKNYPAIRTQIIGDTLRIRDPRYLRALRIVKQNNTLNMDILFISDISFFIE